MPDEITIETQATQLGWVPQDQFHGDVEKWVDAATFVKNGQEKLPILLENNRRLQTQVHTMRGELSHLQTLFQGSQESLTELKKFHDETFTARVDAEKARLRAEIKEARESGDIDTELDSQSRLHGIEEEAKAVAKKAAAPAPAPAPAPANNETPEYLAWKGANDWFDVDKKKSAVVLGLAQNLKAAQPALQGKAFFDALDKEIEEIYPASSGPRPTSKVEGSRSSGGGGGSGSGGGKSYGDLPTAAREMCETQAKKFVGEGRAYKTKADWQAAYTKIYFESEAS